MADSEMERVIQLFRILGIPHEVNRTPESGGIIEMHGCGLLFDVVGNFTTVWNYAENTKEYRTK